MRKTLGEGGVKKEKESETAGGWRRDVGRWGIKPGQIKRREGASREQLGSNSRGFGGFREPDGSGGGTCGGVAQH